MKSQRPSILFILLLLLPIAGKAQQYENTLEDKGVILVLSSYSPDSRRISGFMESFEGAALESGEKYQIFLEDLACNHLKNSDEWIARMKSVLNTYKDTNLKAVIILSQEAWASFYAIKDETPNVPYFICYGSDTGIDINTYQDTTSYYPESHDFIKEIGKHKIIGGQVFEYNIEKNYKLIKEFYPQTEHIALITDNTYGGISLQALVSEYLDEEKDIDLIPIDSRQYDMAEAQEIIKNLPDNTVLLIGTWRVGKEGIYYLSSSINTIIEANPSIPTFTISGIGMGNNVIGGYISNFDYQPQTIYDQIEQYYTEGTVPRIQILDGHYIFDETLLRKIGIKNYQLPEKYTTLNILERQVRTYRTIIYISIVAFIVLLTLLIIILRVNRKNKLLRKNIQAQNIELIEAKEKAEESDKMKSSFLANMSHEIRTPLNSIVGFSNILCDPETTDEEKTEYRDIIVKNADSLLKLINDILDISRLESGRMKFNVVKCDIIGVCHNAMTSISPMHKPGVEYIFNPPIDKFETLADELRLRQIIVNFITNANKFTEKGSIELSININKETNKILFIVTDTGCGIPLEKRNKIFNRFEKLDEFQKGFGLGLAISQQIAKRVGGDIYLDEKYNNGTRIIFERPIELSDKQLQELRGGGVI